ncbi:hypothetical protein ABT324_02520 [Saccharopolyspora sp. NPDC000359]|uniref:hypothetical protein n=1 Tax=Saccharopolyspora sp. NPDC000359 TaxID=3154251 RepID=UPI00332BB7C3
MTKFLLSIHVLAAIVAIGPVTVASSMFPSAVRRAVGEHGTERDVAVLRTLHRICRVYAGVGVVVPVFGFATASSLGVLGDTWLTVSIVLTAMAAGVLGLLVLPRQQRILAAIPHPGPDERAPSRLAMHTGLFNLLWAAVTVLMIVRPGSTTGA